MRYVWITKAKLWSGPKQYSVQSSSIWNPTIRDGSIYLKIQEFGLSTNFSLHFSVLIRIVRKQFANVVQTDFPFFLKLTIILKERLWYEYITYVMRNFTKHSARHLQLFQYADAVASFVTWHICSTPNIWKFRWNWNQFIRNI